MTETEKNTQAWYAKVQTPEGETQSLEVYHLESDKPPVEVMPETFDLDAPNENVPDYDRDCLEADLDEDAEYWVFDADDEAHNSFPRVPDVPTASRPTMFVAIPKDSIIEWTTNQETYYEIDAMTGDELMDELSGN